MPSTVYNTVLCLSICLSQHGPCDPAFLEILIDCYTFLTGFSSSLQWHFTSVWTAVQHRICRSTASRSPVLTLSGICVPPIVTYLPYLVSGSTLTAIGRSQLLAQWPGTHSLILSGIQRAAQTVLCVYLKRTCSRVTSASSTLRVLNDYALYKSTHSLTHSLHGTQ